VEPGALAEPLIDAFGDFADGKCWHRFFCSIARDTINVDIRLTSVWHRWCKGVPFRISATDALPDFRRLMRAACHRL